MNKIEETTKILSFWGEDPVHPEWFETILKSSILTEENNQIKANMIDEMYYAKGDIGNLLNRFVIPQDFITFFTVACAFHMQKSKKADSLSKYCDEAKSTSIQDIVKIYLCWDRIAGTFRIQGTPKVSFQDPSLEEKRGIVDVVQTFRSHKIESLIHRMRHSGDPNMKEKADELEEKIRMVKEQRLLIDELTTMAEHVASESSSNPLLSEEGCT